MSLVTVEGASFGYGGRAVVGVEQLELHAGGALGIFGTNGSGKTTLVRGLAGLIKPVAGRVCRADGLRIGYLPQHRALQLHWPMTAFDAASLATRARRWLGRLGKQAGRVTEAMERLDVSRLANHAFATLSGGQQQRVLLAGALAAGPQLLILDEPTDSLDVRSRDMLLATLKECASGGMAVVLISHEVEDLLSLTQRVAWVHRRDLEEDGASRVELLSPQAMAQRVLEGRPG